MEPREKEISKAVNLVIAQQKKLFYETHLARMKNLKLDNLLCRKNIFLLATLNPPPEQVITDAVKSFSVASMETVFGNCLHCVLREILKAVYPLAIVASGESVDLDVVTKKARLIIELKSGANTHNRTSYAASGTHLEAARARTRLMREVSETPVVTIPIHATCYGKKRLNVYRDKWDAQGQTLWFIASGGDANFYIKLVRMFTRQTQTFRRKLENTMSSIIEKLTEEFKLRFCDQGVRIRWEELAKLSCENLTPDIQKKLQEEIIG